MSDPFSLHPASGNMRLTLRTLLAYLDQTLDTDDIAILKAKLEASPRAMSLVQRIQSSVDRQQLSAPSPDAVGPLENANVMSEYLDSTLSVEQVAEIEQWCQESDVSLAEAAACHHILAMALGQPARVPDRLRDRIYSLSGSEELAAMEAQSSRTPDMSLKSSPDSEVSRYSSLSIPASAAHDVADQETVMATGSPRDDAGGLAAAAVQASTSIGPVGPNDSGVSQAATRLRETAGEPSTTASSVAATNQAARRALLETDGYGGSIRPSRMTAWLVSLALVGVFLFAAVRVFEPMLRLSQDDRVAQRQDDLAIGGMVDPPPAPDALNQPDLVVKAPDRVVKGNVTPNAETPRASSFNNDTADEEPRASLDSKPVGNTPAISNADQSESGDESKLPGIEPTDAPPKSPPTGSARTPQFPPAEFPPATSSVGVPSPDPSSLSDSANSDIAANDSTSGETSSKSTASQPAVSEISAKPSPAEAGMPEVVEPSEESKSEESKSVMPPLAMDPAEEDNASEAAETAEGPGEIVARLINPESLVLVRSRDNWRPLTSQATVIRSNETILAPPLYRPILIATAEDQPSKKATPVETVTEVPNPTDNEGADSDATSDPTAVPVEDLGRARVSQPGDLEWTLAGPTRLRINRTEDGLLRTNVIDGRLLIASTRENIRTQLELGRRSIGLQMPDSQTVLAVEITHLRPAGMDPLVPTNRQPAYRILALQGSVDLSPIGDTVAFQPVKLESGQQWRARDQQPAAVSDVEDLPAWVDVPLRPDFMVKSAREGLRNFISDDPAADGSLEQSLREAMGFRSGEVVALAAETLLMIGRGDVYFGSGGILSRPRQRPYWTEHFQTLRAEIARSAESAQAIRRAIMRSELADSDALFRLLVGFDSQQLAAGGDEKLVQWLDSPSMPVRVLAIENLSQITGETLGYRPEQENAKRRDADIRKWETKLKRDDIKYAEKP